MLYELYRSCPCLCFSILTLTRYVASHSTMVQKEGKDKTKSK